MEHPCVAIYHWKWYRLGSLLSYTSEVLISVEKQESGNGRISIEENSQQF
jgi:hypothetical protein